MNHKTKLSVITITFITIILTMILFLIYEYEKTYTFRAYVKEVHETSAILIPIGSNRLNYTSIIVRNIINVNQGDIIYLTIERNYRKVYPPIAEVIRYESR